MALLYPRSHPQWRAEGICIGEGYRRGMGIARCGLKEVIWTTTLHRIGKGEINGLLQIASFYIVNFE